jgi:hypothetical protein
MTMMMMMMMMMMMVVIILIRIIYVGFEVSTAVVTEISICWDTS